MENDKIYWLYLKYYFKISKVYINLSFISMNKYRHKMVYLWSRKCDKKLKSKNSLKIYQPYIHNVDVKWYYCDIENCDKKFKSREGLNVHKVYIHDINVKWHYCDIEGCDKKFKNIQYLKLHKKSCNHKWNPTENRNALWNALFESISITINGECIYKIYNDTIYS